MSDFSDFFPPASSNNILEILAGTADGRTVSVSSGSYSFQNVTARQTLTTTHTDITGSSISYKPPTGTKFVKYKFSFKVMAEENSAITGYRLLFDGTTVTHAATGGGTNYSTNLYKHGNWIQNIEFVFDLTVSTTDKGEGQIASSYWTSAKTIKVTGREYSGTYEANAHGNSWEDGGGASGNEVYTKPTLIIIAYS